MKKRTVTPIEKIILGTIAVAGVLSVVAIAPGIGPALKLFGFDGKKKKYPSRYIRSTLTRMKEKGLIEFVESSKGGKAVQITNKGQQKLEAYERSIGVGQRPNKWNGRWHIVIFDIPEKKRALRNSVRNHLVRFGFVKLQGSVWVYPYDCEEIITLLKADLRVGKEMLYIVASHIEMDKQLRAQFELS